MKERASERAADLRERTKQFAVRIIRLYAAVPRERMAQVLASQMLRSGTSVGAQYREARRARSTAGFISKVSGALQEMEETTYWFELLVEASVVPAERMTAIRAEADELIRVFVASINTARKRR